MSRTKTISRLLELLALCGLAIAEPILRVFGGSPTTFQANDVTGTGVLWFAVLVALAPPLTLFGLEQAVGRLLGTGAQAGLHRILLTGLAGLAALGLLARFTRLDIAVMLGPAIVSGLCFALIVDRLKPAREWVRLLAVGPFVFMAMFILSSPAGDVAAQQAVAPMMLERVEARPAEAGLPDVVLIVLDELPLVSLLDGEGGIDAGLFPSLHRLSTTSTWYRNAITVSDLTQDAVPAALSGRMPSARTSRADLGVAPTALNHPETIFTMLGEEYRMDVWEWQQLCPAQLCPRHSAGGSLAGLIGDAGDVLREQLDGEPEAPPALDGLAGPDESIEQSGRVEDFVSSLQPSADGGPTLHFLHLLLPHGPWQLMPSGTPYANPGGGYGIELDDSIYTWGSDELADLARRRHGLQLRYVDRQLGAILDRLEAQGRFDSSIVVVVADHGIGFTPGQDVRDLAPGSAPEVAFVPMLVKDVDQSRAVLTDVPATTLDLLPTLADRIGVRVPWDTDGRSLVTDWSTTAPPRSSLRSTGGFSGPLEPGPVTIPDALFEEVLEWDPIGVGDDADLALFRGEHFPDLVGTATTEVRVGPPAAASMRLRTEAAPVWDGEGRIPTWVDADLDGADLGDRVAVLVNDRIGVVATVTDLLDRPAAVSAIVPEQFLVRGTNRFALALVDGTADDPVLRPITES